MRNWKSKLTSRKFWAAILGVVLSVMTVYGSSDDDKTKVTGLITATGTLVIYILAESSVDKKNS